MRWEHSHFTIGRLRFGKVPLLFQGLRTSDKSGFKPVTDSKAHPQTSDGKCCPQYNFCLCRCWMTCRWAGMWLGNQLGSQSSGSMLLSTGMETLPPGPSVLLHIPKHFQMSSHLHPVCTQDLGLQRPESNFQLHYSQLQDLEHFSSDSSTFLPWRQSHGLSGKCVEAFSPIPAPKEKQEKWQLLPLLLLLLLLSSFIRRMKGMNRK